MPTVETYSIDNGGGGDYTSAQSFENDHDHRDFVTEDVIVEGEQEDFEDTGRLIFGHTGSGDSDATRYWHYKNAAGSRFNPRTGSGARLTSSGTSVIQVGPAAVRMTGLGVHNNRSGTSASPAVYVTSSATATVIAESIYATVSVGTSTSTTHAAFRLSGPIECRNCIADDAGNGSANNGFRVTVNGCEFRSCVAYGFSNSNTNKGFYLSTYDDTVVQNSISVNNGDDQIDFDGSPTGSTVESNIASDGSASDPGGGVTGVDGIDDVDADAIFVDASNQDFRLRPGSPAHNTGKDLSAHFTDDFDGTDRTADGKPWDRGAYHRAGTANRLATCGAGR